MNPRTIIFIVVALAMAGGTALMVKGWMNAQQKALEAARKKPEGPKDEILVAKVNLPAGTLIDEKDHLTWQAWPSQKILKAYVRKGLQKPADFAGGVVRSAVFAGEPITSGRVVKKGEKGFMAAMLSPGLRAITVKVNATSGIAGFVNPGDRVDLMMLHSIAKDDGEKKKGPPARVTETILENVRILAVDQVVTDTGNKAAVRRTVTLEVTPKQAEAITVAEALGKLSLALRPLTREDQNIAGVEMDPNNPNNREPGTRGKSHTTSGEVSSFSDGIGSRGGFQVVILRGNKSNKVMVPK